MLKYQQKRDLRREMPASKAITILPAFSEGHPTVGHTVYRWFNPQGEYIGWSDFEVGKKFLMGKLYYKTKGAYRIVTRRSHSNRAAKMIHVYEKGGSALALYGVLRPITDVDLIDLDDKKALLKVTRVAVEKFTPTSWNLLDYPNPYKCIPQSFREKLATDMTNFLKTKHQEMLEHIDQQMVSIDQAAAIDAANTAATKGDWDFGGFTA